MDSSKIYVGLWFGIASLMVLDLLCSGLWNRPVWTSISSFPLQYKDGASTSASSPTASHDILDNRDSSSIATPTTSHDILHNRASSPTASHDILHSRASSLTGTHDILHSRDNSNIVSTDTIKNTDGASTATSSPTASVASSPTALHDILHSRASSPTASQNILHSRDGSKIVATDTIKNTDGASTAASSPTASHASSPTTSHDILHSRASSPTASQNILHSRDNSNIIATDTIKNTDVASIAASSPTASHASSPTASHDILHSRASSPTASQNISHSRDGSNIVATETIKNTDGASTTASSSTASHDILHSRASSPTTSQNILHSGDDSNIVATDNIKNTTSTIPKDELEAALEGASMENKTLIIAVANKACTEEGSFLDLLLQSFQVGEGTQLLSNHLLLAAIDQTAFEQCNMRKLHCYKLMTDGVDYSGEKTYMSSDYLKITWMKTLFQATVLGRGYNFIFTDMDVIWLRNPFERLVHQGVDLQISCDFYNGRPSDLDGKAPNTGFYFVVSNNKTISMFDKWYAARNDSMRLHDQHVLQALLKNGLIQQLDLKVRFQDPLYFGGFCSSGSNYGKVVTMHANCCTSFSAKMRGLRAILDGWIKFKGQSNATSTVQWSAQNYCM